MLYSVYTDGSCYPNGSFMNRGGYGFIIIDEAGREVYNFVEKEINTTNNRMELKAVIEAIRMVLKSKAKAIIYTDSQYVQKGYTEWMYKWHKQGFIKKSKPIPNQELWWQLWALRGLVEVQWVKGHADNPYNIRIDELVNYAAEIPQK